MKPGRLMSKLLEMSAPGFSLHKVSRRQNTHCLRCLRVYDSLWNLSPREVLSAVSHLSHQESPFTICGIGKTCPNILFRKVRKVFQDLLWRHPRGKIRKHIVNRDPHTSDTRLAIAPTWLNRYKVLIARLHSPSIRTNMTRNRASRHESCPLKAYCERETRPDEANALKARFTPSSLRTRSQATGAGFELLDMSQSNFSS